MRNNKRYLLSKQKEIGAIAFFMVVTLLLVCSPALAHNVTVFAWVEGETVHVESKFSGGRRPVDAPVKVYDTQGNLLLEGLTDDKGEFSFKVPKKEELKVVLLAGMGHKGEWTIQPAEFGNDRAVTPLSEAATEPSSLASNEPGRETTAGGGQKGSSVPTGHVTTAQIQGVVENALDAKLKPIMKMLVETRQSGPKVSEILGGIGYIFGLIGVAAYVRSKRQNP